MTKRDSQDLVAYAMTLAEGGALKVYRLAQYVDYDTQELSNAVGEFCGCRRHYDNEDYDSSCATCKGIHSALTKALGDAEDRAYQRRSQPRKKNR